MDTRRSKDRPTPRRAAQSLSLGRSSSATDGAAFTRPAPRVMFPDGMALRKIVRFPQPFLRQATVEVAPAEIVNKHIRTLVDDMMETMCDVSGAGLAAIQVGAAERIFIIDGIAAGGEKTDQPKVFINPIFDFLSPETDVKEEGCLSFPGIFIAVKRSLVARIRAFDIDGKPFETEARDFFARALQHEYDHLENRLLYDHAGPLKRQMIKRKLDRMTDEEAMDILSKHGE